MAIYLKRRRTTIEEWSRSVLRRTDVESNGTSIWPHFDDGPDKTGDSQPAKSSQIAVDVESCSEKESDERDFSKSVSKTKQVTGEQK